MVLVRLAIVCMLIAFLGIFFRLRNGGAWSFTEKLSVRKLDAAMLDLFLAIAHHILIFFTFRRVFTELMLVRRPGFDQAAVARIASIDLW